MVSGVVDTHAYIWYLNADQRLSATAKQFVDAATQAGNEIGVPAIVLIEVVYLVEKGRLPADMLARMIADMKSPSSVFTEIPLSIAIAQAMQQVPRSDVPDMPDRIIAATALSLAVPVISRDSKIQASQITTIW